MQKLNLKIKTFKAKHQDTQLKKYDDAYLEARRLHITLSKSYTAFNNAPPENKASQLERLMKTWKAEIHQSDCTLLSEQHTDTSTWLADILLQLLSCTVIIRISMFCFYKATQLKLDSYNPDHSFFRPIIATGTAKLMSELTKKLEHTEEAWKPVI